MADHNDINILEEIIDRKGACLRKAMCERCPFAKNCLPAIVFGKRRSGPSRQERVNMALDAISSLTLLDDEPEYDREH